MVTATRIHIRYHPLERPTKITVLASKLSGRPLDILQGLIRENVNYADAVRQLAQQINPVSDGFYVREFLECKQKPGETVPDFAYKLKTLHNKAFPNADNIELRLARLKDHFVNGLEIDLRFKFQDKKGANQGENVKTFDALVTEAHQYDINRKAKKDERARVDYINSITQPSEIKVLCDAIQSLTTSLANIKEQQKQTIAKVEQISINKG